MKVKILKFIAVTLVFAVVSSITVACNNQHSHEFNNGLCACGEMDNTFKTEGLTFELVEEKYSVTGYTGTEKTVYIPSKYNDLPVIKIGENAFADNTVIEKVVIRNGVTTIGDYAFKQSTLSEIELPDTLAVIRPTAFIGCDNLSYNQEDDLSYLGNKGNKYLLLVSAKTTATSVEINENCKIIGTCAFENCIELVELKVHKNLARICDYAFYGASALRNIDFYGTKTEWENVFLESEWIGGSAILAVSVYGDLINLE